MSKYNVGDVFAVKLSQGRGRPTRVKVEKNRGIFLDVVDRWGGKHIVQPAKLRVHTATKNMGARA